MKLGGAASDSNTSVDTGNNLSIFGGKGFQRPRLDWREFFNDQELETAYQIVEVEQRDETDHGSSDDGSNSDPSDDNLDAEDVFRNVYGVKNPEVMIEVRKKKELEFKEDVQTQI